MMNVMRLLSNLERSFETKAHSEKSMKVSDMQVTDEDDFPPNSMMIKAKNIIMKEGVDCSSRGTQFAHCVLPARPRLKHTAKPLGIFLPSVSTEMLTIAVCANVNLFKEFKTACPNLWYRLNVKEFTDIDNQ